MTTAILESKDFNRLIAATKDFIAPFSSKPKSLYHRYIKLDVDADKKVITAAGVNGYALSVERAPLTFSNESFSVYILPLPRFPIHTLTTIDLTGKDAIIRNDGKIYGFEQPEYKEPFINYEQFFKRLPYTVRIGFDPKLLTAALKAEEVSTGRERESIIELSGPVSPCFIRSKDDKSLRMVLPVRIKEAAE